MQTLSLSKDAAGTEQKDPCQHLRCQGQIMPTPKGEHSHCILSILYGQLTHIYGSSQLCCDTLFIHTCRALG